MDFKALELVIFDFDGTLAELTIDFDAMRADVVALAVDHGLDYASSGERYVLEAISVLAARHGDDGRRFAASAHAAIVARELAAARHGRLFPGARPTLAALGRLGLKTAVITRNCRLAVESVFPDVAACCDLFVPRDDAPRPKPAPEHLRLVLDRLGVLADASLVVGDHPIDVASARAVGAHACGIPTGRMTLADLAHADITCPSLDSLASLIADARA